MRTLHFGVRARDSCRKAEDYGLSIAGVRQRREAGCSTAGIAALKGRSTGYVLSSDSYHKKRQTPEATLQVEKVPHAGLTEDASEQPHFKLTIRPSKAVMLAKVFRPRTHDKCFDITFRGLEQLSAGETAESLQSTIPAVKTRLFRARRMLSEALKPRARALPQ